MNIYKILRYPEIIPCDKRLHFILGVTFSFIVSIITGNIYIETISIVLFGFGIELFQYITKSGKVELLDAVATIIGGLFIIVEQIIR